MRTSDKSRRVFQKAQELFESGLVQDAVVRSQGQLNKPIPIIGPEADLAGWFVGVTIGNQIVGFMQFDRQMQVLRYSSFQKSPGSLVGCPPRDDWLDASAVKKRAKAHIGVGDQIASPYLTYDGNPSRLVWAVPVKMRREGHKIIFVAGDFAYVADQPRGTEPTTDGNAARD